MNPRTTAFAILSLLLLSLAPAAHGIEAGVARIDVTPPEPIRLTGYGNRKTNSLGVEQKVWAKALALGSDRDGPSVLITLDNCGIAESTYRELVSRLTKRTRLRQAGIVIACSHTHTGPCTTDWAPNIFASDISPVQQAVIDRYTRGLIGKLEQVALAALKDRRPAQLAWAQGEVGFARNRRVVAGRTAQFGENATGPVDHALPVLRVTDPDGRLRALVANYACHCTTLGGEFNHVCGDWAGYAQEAIERDQPGAVALITIGCGGDANPSPRGGADFGLALAKRHGEELAAEVKRLLGLTFTPLPGKLMTQLKEIRLPFGPHFTREAWQSRATNSGIDGYHAMKWLDRLDHGGKLPDSLYYPISTWRFGDDLALVFLPGEVVVDYALRLKQEFDPARLWVSGYSLYVPCYIPSRRILAEGGYEAESSLWYYDRPARISTNAEDLIIKTVHELLPKQFLFDKRKAEFPDPKTPRQALATFRTKPGFTVELVASEPLIESPVAIDWDAQGRLWVCEMYDYPTGIHPPADIGRKWGENPPAHAGGYKPGGRIKVLESTKHDGHYDKATLFLDGLPFPTGVMPWRNGALICAAPDILYAEDTDGDGRADVVRTNFTGFATHNYQARVNGFRWGLDGWLHGSSGLFGGKVKSRVTGRDVDLGGRDFRIQPDTGEIEPLAGISQMGRVRDDFDNWFGNDNSTLLWHYPLPDHYLRRNPHVTYPDPRVNVAFGVPPSGGAGTRPPKGGTPNKDPNLLFPISRTLERFNSPESANRVTSACGIDLYRDDLLGTNYHGNAFICEPVHNLVTRLELEPDGVTFAGHRAPDEQKREFLAGTDNWFRPVQVRTGPDGALWVVDMYRFVIEHPRWITPERLKELDVRAGADMGRIYRVYPKGATLRPIRDLTKLTQPDLVKSLVTTNGPTRDLVQIELLQRGATLSSIPTNASESKALAKRLHTAPGKLPSDVLDSFTQLSLISTSGLASDPIRAQAASILYHQGAFGAESLKSLLADPSPHLRRLAIQLAERPLSLTKRFVAAQPVDPAGAPTKTNTIRLGELLQESINDSSEVVRLQLALSFGEWDDPAAGRALGRLAATRDPWLLAAVLSSVRNRPAAIFAALPRGAVPMDGPFVGQLAATAGSSLNARGWQEMLRAITPSGDAPGQTWEWSALESLLDALHRHHTTALALSTSTAEGDRAAANRIYKSLAAARSLALSTNADEASREAAVRLLRHGEGDSSEDLAVLARFLQPGVPTRLQTAALDTLRGRRGLRVSQMLLNDWNRNSPAVRATAVSLLMSRDEWVIDLLNAVEQKTVAPGEIPPASREQMLRRDNAAIRELAGKLFAVHKSASRAEVLGRYQDVPSLTGAVERGAAAFDTHCAQCHAWRGHGHAVGPNLAEFVGKTVADFVLAILDPNAAINPNFLAYNIDTRDGRSLTGIVRGETASSLTLVQGGGLEEKILRSEAKEIRASPLSLMPEGLEQVLTPQDVADLVAWLKQGAPAEFGAASANPGLAAKNRAEFLKSGPNAITKVLTSAEPLPYRSWIGTLPLAYCRQSAGVNRLEWHSERRLPARRESTNLQRAVPEAGAPDTVSFRFPAAMGFASQPQGQFTLHVNGKPVLDFDVALADAAWSSPDGRVRLSYSVLEANSEDSNGVLVIHVAPALLKTDEATRFEVSGSASESQRWFGLYLIER